MGGRVLRDDDTAITGLHAAGEIIGGLHGKNRLGGNALTECAVFGRIVGERIVSQLRNSSNPGENTATGLGLKAGEASDGIESKGLRDPEDRVITEDELKKHDSKDSCWVALYGKVYDFTDFLEEHPAGA